ncbi:sensor histidine kinase, partial [Burkholderia vietnamiensis]|uniref:sensor histidine kinase n=1 Tax=Burkholderia vietnamiensis TaxID=60552 RepID=UPI0018C8C6E2
LEFDSSMPPFLDFTKRWLPFFPTGLTGPGIPLAERHRVFDPFYRTLGSEQIGSGLGLSIVQAIAHRIGAEIRLDFVDETQTGLSVAVIVPMR